MEDVLAVYTRPRDPDRPVVCLDETSKQLIAETRAPMAMQPGRPARIDSAGLWLGASEVGLDPPSRRGGTLQKKCLNGLETDFCFTYSSVAKKFLAQGAREFPALNSILLKGGCGYEVRFHPAVSLYHRF